MDIKKEQKMDMYFEKIAWYGTYVDCLMRVLDEFIEGGDGNIKPCDIPNLMQLNTKLAYRLHRTIQCMKSDWEFM